MKVIVIGATGTIGSELVKQLTERKHEVLPASRHSQYNVDIEDTASIRALFKQVPDADAVAVCAGDAAIKPLSELTDADYELSVRSKLMGQITVSREAMSHLNDGGSITLTSGTFTEPSPDTAAISLADGGLDSFIEAAALSLPRGLRINTVSPPWVQETAAKLGLQVGFALPVSKVAGTYVTVIEGSQQGQVVRPHEL